MHSQSPATHVSTLCTEQPPSSDSGKEKVLLRAGVRRGRLQSCSPRVGADALLTPSKNPRDVTHGEWGLEATLEVLPECISCVLLRVCVP
jgi:hypothetical protein